MYIACVDGRSFATRGRLTKCAWVLRGEQHSRSFRTKECVLAGTGTCLLDLTILTSLRPCRSPHQQRLCSLQATWSEWHARTYIQAKHRMMIEGPQGIVGGTSVRKCEKKGRGELYSLLLIDHSRFRRDFYLRKSFRIGVKVSIRMPASKQTQPCGRLGAT